MKIGNGRYIGDEILLPQEVVESIVKKIVFSNDHPLDTQTYLWSCCLVSKIWYSAAIAPLYESPVLTNRNFDTFTRTICPPVNAHIRNVGLEHFIRVLDLSVLAYESRNSLTARLIRRVHPSLEVLIAPAVTFSVSSLAPLSKSTNLRILDLSMIYEKFSLEQILRSIDGLERLQFLSLPSGIFRFSNNYPSETIWPPNLRSLTFNRQIPESWRVWDIILKGLPQSVNRINIKSCENLSGFFDLSNAESSHNGIEVLAMDLPTRRDLPFHFLSIFQAFPSLKKASISLAGIPYDDRSMFFPALESLQYKSLEHLALHGPPRALDFMQTIKIMASLETIIDTAPKLRRLDLPSLLFEFSQASPELLESLLNLVIKLAEHTSRDHNTVENKMNGVNNGDKDEIQAGIFLIPNQKIWGVHKLQGTTQHDIDNLCRKASGLTC